ncbi:Hsp20/alpha crystallin family protein, partial [Variovorax sp. M-6]|uniref:Hsp20/alpha crystallin family protein n=1 Tax=Variovorax sp. M-6 TaxID=3233041 RepID=UPI003F9995E4
YADLPGVPRDKLHLNVESDSLTIEGEIDMTVPDGLQSTHTEVGVARFHRVFTLSKELDTEKISAELAQGVLKLRIPKAEHAQPRRINVEVN